MGITLISSTPSPYARKVRIALIEKDVHFKLQTEVPWDHTTETPRYNPLEKLPILVVTDDKDDGNPDARPKMVVYESSVILEYIGLKHTPTADHSLIPLSIDGRIEAKQIEALADGMCDSMVLRSFEERREHISEPWLSRQKRKIEGGMAELAIMVKKKGVHDSGFLVQGQFSIADIAVGSMLGFMALRWPDDDWQTRFPELAKYWKKLEERKSFKETVPVMFKIQDKIV